MKDYQIHAGTWKFYEKVTLYQGELHINYEKQVIALEIIIPASEEKPMPRPPYIGKIPYICGTIFSGAKILLYNCTTGKEHAHVGSHTTQIIYADYAFWGLESSSEDEIKFTKANFDFGEIIEWSGLCSYFWDFNESGDHILQWNRNELISAKLSDNLKVTFMPKQGSFGGNKYSKEQTVTQHISVELSYENLTTWEAIIEDTKCVQYLIGLGMNKSIEIHEANYYHSSIFSEYENADGELEKVYNHIPMIFGTGKTNLSQNTRQSDYLFTLEDILNYNVFEKWRINYHMLKPILDLYFTAFYGTAGTPEMLFLNLTQALETFHARFVTDDIKVYSKRVDDLIESFCNGKGNIEQWKDFLLDEGQAKNSSRIFLRSRLADLAFAEGVLPFWPDRKLPSTYITKVVDTRNYYTHYNSKKLEKAFKKGELPRVNGHLLALLEYHLLVLMGFSTSEVRKRTVEKVNRINDGYHIKQSINSTER